MIEQISYDEVRSIAQTLHTTSNKMKNILDTTNSRMRSVNTSGTWKSNAAETFSEKFNTLSRKFSLFYDSVEKYSKFLNQTVDTYKAADEAIGAKAEQILNS